MVSSQAMSSRPGVPRGDIDHAMFEELCEACKRGDLAKVRKFVEAEQVPINMRDRWDSTPLYYSALCGHIQITEYLLSAGSLCDPNTFEGERCLYGALNDKIRALLRSHNVSKTMDAASDYALFLFNLISRPTTTFSDITFTLPKAAFTMRSFPEYIPRFALHRFVLAARSTFLASQLLERWKDADEIAVKQYKLTAVAFESVMNWFYTGDIPKEPVPIADCVFLAKQWKLSSLLDHLTQSTISEEEGGQKTTRAVVTRDLETVRQDMSRLVELLLTHGHTWCLRSLDGGEAANDLEEEGLKLISSSSPNVVVVVGDRKFPCHKAVLMRSEYFSAMLTGGFRETAEKSIGSSKLLELSLSAVDDPDVFSIILEFLYTDKTSRIGPDTYSAVLSAADIFLLDRLKHQTVSQITTSPVETISRPDILLRHAWNMNLPRLEQHWNKWFAETIDLHIIVAALAEMKEKANLQNTSENDMVVDDNNYDVALVEMDEFRRTRIFVELVRDSSESVVNRQETDTIIFVDDLRWWLGKLHGFDGLDDIGIVGRDGAFLVKVGEKRQERWEEFRRRMDLLDAVLEVLNIYA